MKTNTYLNFAGSTEEAFRFYESAFGGKLTDIVRFRDMPMEGVSIPEADQDKVMHVSLPLGDGQMLMATSRPRGISSSSRTWGRPGRRAPRGVGRTCSGGPLGHISERRNPGRALCTSQRPGR